MDRLFPGVPPLLHRRVLGPVHRRRLLSSPLHLRFFLDPSWHIRYLLVHAILADLSFTWRMRRRRLWPPLLPVVGHAIDLLRQKESYSYWSSGCRKRVGRIGLPEYGSAAAASSRVSLGHAHIRFHPVRNAVCWSHLSEASDTAPQGESNGGLVCVQGA